MDLTTLDEKKGRNLNLESNAPKGQFTPVSFPTIARYAEIYAWVAAEHHPWKDLRSDYEQADLGLLIQATADSWLDNVSSSRNSLGVRFSNYFRNFGFKDFLRCYNL